MIVLDDQGRMLIKPNPTWKRLGDAYSMDLPGGGIGKDESIEDAAARECKEEAQITPEDIHFTGIHYTYEVPNDSKEEWGTWGHVSFVCVARKGAPYTGYVAPIDREEEFTKNMIWVDPNTIDIIPAHEEAIRWYKQYYWNPKLQESFILDTDDYRINNFISGKDTYVNYKLWTSGKVNKIFIIGLSGSGKSTLGKKLTKQFNAEYVQLDRFRGNVHYSDEDFQKDNPILWRYFTNEVPWERHTIKTMTYERRTEEFKKCFYWLLKQSDRMVIEGAMEKLLIADKDLQTYYPIVFKGTSMAKSMIRMLRRELIEKPNFESAPISWILKFISRYNDMKNLNNQARDSVMQHNPEFEMFEEAAEFKPMEIVSSSNIDPKTGKYINKGGDKYIKYFTALEPEWLKKVKYKSWPDLRHGKPQPVIYDENGDCYRPRCEVMVLDGYKVLIDPTNNRGGFGYSLPGGGIDPKEDITTGARRECEEEAKIIPKNCVYTGIAWMLEFASPEYNKGSISFVCVAERGKEYKGYVKIEDRDSFVDNAKWVDYRKFKLGEPHRIAIERFRNMQLKEEGIMDLDRSFLDAEYETIDEDTGFIDQPVVFSGDDIYVNFDKFTSGEAKTCLITGLSGSGKSTLAKKIAEKMGAYYVETDTISFKISSRHPERANWGYIKEHDKYLYKYFKEVGLEPDCMQKYDWHGSKKNEIVTPFVRWLCLERDDDGLVVCEGGDVSVALRDAPELSEMPIVFKGTSILKSMFRRLFRSTGKKVLLAAITNAVIYYESQYEKLIPEVNGGSKDDPRQPEYQTQHEAAGFKQQSETKTQYTFTKIL